MTSSRMLIARRALILAATSAAPTVVFAADANWDSAQRDMSAQVWQYNRGVQFQYAGQGSTGSSGPTLSAATSATLNIPSVRNQQFLVFTNPGLAAGPSTTATYASWSNSANWTPAVVPDGGGTATFDGLNTAGHVDDRGFGGNVLLDSNPTLSGITWTAGGGEDIHYLDGNHTSGAATAIVTDPTNGLTLTHAGYNYGGQGGQPELSTTYLIGNIYTNISGTGGVKVSTTAAYGWTPGKSFTGGVTITNGTLGLWAIDPNTGALEGAGAPDDSSLGASGGITLNNGSFQSVDIRQAPQPVNFSRAIALTPGTTNNVWFNQGGTFSSLISGGAGGTLTLGKPGFGGALVFTNNNTMTSAIRPLGVGAVVLRDNGAFASSPLIDLAGGGGTAFSTPLTLGQSDSASANRLNDSGTVRMNGAPITLIAGTANYNETIGTLTLGGGINTLTLQPNGANTVSLTGTLSRENRGGLFVRGQNLGVGSASLFLNNGASVAVGGGGAAGSTNQSVIPYVFGVKSTSVAANTTLGVGSATLVTYDAINGVRPLDLTTEYASLGGAGATDNVRVSAAASAAAGGQTINALVMDSPSLATTGGPTLSGGTLTVTSGAVLNAAAGSVIAAPLNFGSAEGVIMANSAGSGTDASSNGLNITGAISGSGGLTKVGQGNLYLNGANTYTGQTTINQGRVFLTANVLADGVTPGPFGLSTTPVVIAAPSTGNQNTGGGQTRLLIDPPSGSASILFARDMQIVGRGTSGALLGSFAPLATLNITGNVALNNTPNAPTLLGGTVIMSGNVSGTGVLEDLGTAGATSLVRLTGNNAGWTGGAMMNGGAATTTADVWELGTDTALGTGPVQYDGPSIIRAINGAHTISNEFFSNPASAEIVMFDGALTLSGQIHLGTGIRGSGNVDSTGTLEGGFAVAAGQTVTMSGTLTDGGFQLVTRQLTVDGLATGSVTTQGGGTLVLSGNNNTDDRIFVGAAGYAATTDPNNGNAAVPQVPGLAGGTLKLASPGAMGRSGVQVEYDGSAVDIAGGITVGTANNNIFLRPGSGVGGNGELMAEGGNNTFAGNVALLPSEGAGTLAVASRIGVATGSSLTIAGELSDYTGQFVAGGTTGFNTNTLEMGNNTGTSSSGTLIVRRLADVDVLNRGVNDTSSLAQVTINQGTIKISDGRDASSASNGTITGESTTNKTSQVRGLTIAAGATLDLNTNDMVLDYSSTSPLQTLRTQLQSGFNNGAWNGTGITSTGAQTGALAAPGHKTAIGYVEASAVRSTFGDASLFSGAAVPDNTTILMRYTYAGDNNVDGTVDLTDFTFLAAHFNQQTGATWIDGDYNYDGKVDLTDFTFLAGNFNAAAFGDSAPAGSSLGAVVPEPASFGLLGLVAGGLMARRRRRN